MQSAYCLTGKSRNVGFFLFLELEIFVHAMVLTKIGDPLEWTELEDPIPDTHGMTLGHEAVNEIYELSELALQVAYS